MTVYKIYDRERKQYYGKWGRWNETGETYRSLKDAKEAYRSASHSVYPLDSPGWPLDGLQRANNLYDSFNIRNATARISLVEFKLPECESTHVQARYNRRLSYKSGGFADKPSFSHVYCQSYKDTRSNGYYGSMRGIYAGRVDINQEIRYFSFSRANVTPANGTIYLSYSKFDGKMIDTDYRYEFDLDNFTVEFRARA